MRHITTEQEIRAAVTLGFLLAVVCSVLYGCGDDEYARKQAERDWNAKVARACLPAEGDTLVNIRPLGEDSYTFRRYSHRMDREPMRLTIIERDQ